MTSSRPPAALKTIPATASTLPAGLPTDIRAFLLDYPSNNSRSKQTSTANVAFYEDRGPAKPSDKSVEALHTLLKGNYDELEYNHSFIQWLFPIQEHGVNHLAQPLTKEEIATVRSSDTVRQRHLESYRIMLDFYGMRLVDDATGEVERKPDEAAARTRDGGWRARFNNLTRHSHNFLRITRIVKSNSEVHQRYMF